MRGIMSVYRGMRIGTENWVLGRCIIIYIWCNCTILLACTRGLMDLLVHHRDMVPQGSMIYRVLVIVIEAVFSIMMCHVSILAYIQ